MKKIFGICFFVLMTGCILTHSSLSLAYAALGLSLWYEKMVPVLLPFMILSGTLIRMGMTDSPDPSGKTFVRKNLSPARTGNLCDPGGLFVRISHGCPDDCGFTEPTGTFFGGRTISAGLLQQSGTGIFSGFCTATTA